MQVERAPKVEMQRNMDLIRELLLGIEADPRLDGSHFIKPDAKDNLGVVGVTAHSTKEIGYNLELLIQAGFVDGKLSLEAMPLVSKLTWQGHEFLDNIRDSGIWGKTKERLKGLPTVAFSVLGEIAKAEIKKQLGLP